MRLIRTHKFVQLLLGSLESGWYVKIGRRLG